MDKFKLEVGTIRGSEVIGIVEDRYTDDINGEIKVFRTLAYLDSSDQLYLGDEYTHLSMVEDMREATEDEALEVKRRADKQVDDVSKRLEVAKRLTEQLG